MSGVKTDILYFLLLPHGLPLLSENPFAETYTGKHYALLLDVFFIIVIMLQSLPIQSCQQELPKT